VDPISDAKLVSLARSGDKEAFGHLVERHQQAMARIAMGMVPDHDIARELANEAMLQAYLSLDRLREADRFQSWLHGIMLNVCRGYLRDRRPEPFSLEALAGGVFLEGAALSFEPDPHEVFQARELHRVVLRAVDALSPKNRAATLLFYYEHPSLREIAATLGVSMAAVKGRLHKSRGRLKELLESEYSQLGRGVTTRREVRGMVRVTIADITQQKRQGEGKTGSARPQYVVLLLDSDGGRVLPIWIGRGEAVAIGMALKEVPVPRPMTHAFTHNLLNATGAVVEEVRVESLRDDTFYAVVKLRVGKKVREVDARPSDAIALAVLSGSPIYAAEEVMERAAIAMDEVEREVARQREGIPPKDREPVLLDLEKRQPRWKPMSEEEKAEMVARFKEHPSHGDPIYDYLFGGEGEQAESEA
jgi:RNA polymerase sigma factor (sigma-70 family)